MNVSQTGTDFTEAIATIFSVGRVEFNEALFSSISSITIPALDTPYAVAGGATHRKMMFDSGDDFKKE